MKKIRLGLFPRVLIAIALGALLGMILPEVGVRILKTVNVIIAQLLKFIVPLLVLGLVTPAIASLGRGAGKMLLTVVVLSYLSTVLAGVFAYGCATSLLPHYLSAGELTPDAVAAVEYKPYIDLKIPPLCDVMTALVLSFMIGIGIIFTGAPALRKGCEEFGNIVKLTIEKAIIPMLPVYIFTMIAEMSAKGVFASLMGTGVKVILTGIVLTIVYLVILYVVASPIDRKNPLKCMYNMLPAYLTAFSVASSSAVIPVTLQCTLKNNVKPAIANFVIPLCANVHMVGSTIKLAVSALAIILISGGQFSFGLYFNFLLMQAVAAVAAPGVMGGVLMASLGLVESILGFSPEQTALMMTFYLALDGYGPACNVTGDGAIALVIDRFFGKTAGD